MGECTAVKDNDTYISANMSRLGLRIGQRKMNGLHVLDARNKLARTQAAVIASNGATSKGRVVIPSYQHEVVGVSSLPTSHAGADLSHPHKHSSSSNSGHKLNHRLPAQPSGSLPYGRVHNDDTAATSRC